MKKLFFLLVLLFPIFSFGQTTVKYRAVYVDTIKSNVDSIRIRSRFRSYNQARFDSTVDFRSFIKYNNTYTDTLPNQSGTFLMTLDSVRNRIFSDLKYFKYSDTTAFRAQLLKNEDSTSFRTFSNLKYWSKTDFDTSRWVTIDKTQSIFGTKTFLDSLYLGTAGSNYGTLKFHDGGSVYNVSLKVNPSVGLSGNKLQYLGNKEGIILTDSDTASVLASKAYSDTNYARKRFVNIFEENNYFLKRFYGLSLAIDTILAWSSGNKVYVPDSLRVLNTIVASDNITAPAINLTSSVPLRFTNGGSGTYTIAVINQSASEFSIEANRMTESPSGTPVPISIGWRGGNYALVTDLTSSRFYTNVLIGTAVTAYGGSLNTKTTGTSLYNTVWTNSAGNYIGGIYETGSSHSQLYLANSSSVDKIVLDGGTGNGTYSGTLAVNGDNITSDGDLTITPAGGDLTIVGNDSTTGTGYFGGNLTPAGRLILPMGEINYYDTTNTGTTVSIVSATTGTTNLVKAAPTTALSADAYQFDNGGANDGRLRYTGATTRMFHVALTVSVTPQTTNDKFLIGISKNGTLLPTSRVTQTLFVAGQDIESTALHVMTELATNDYLEVVFGNYDGTGDVSVVSLTLFAMGM